MLELISELEHKVDELINKNRQFKDELNHIRGEIDEKNSYIHEVEESNGNLERELEDLRNNQSGKDQEINEGAEKLRGILSRMNFED